MQNSSDAFFDYSDSEKILNVFPINVSMRKTFWMNHAEVTACSDCVNAAKKHKAKLIHNWAFSTINISKTDVTAGAVRVQMRFPAGPEKFTTDYHTPVSSASLKGYVLKS